MMLSITKVDRAPDEKSVRRAGVKIKQGVMGAKCPRPVNAAQPLETPAAQPPQPARPLVQIGPLDV